MGVNSGGFHGGSSLNHHVKFEPWFPHMGASDVLLHLLRGLQCVDKSKATGLLLCRVPALVEGSMSL